MTVALSSTLNSSEQDFFIGNVEALTNDEEGDKYKKVKGDCPIEGEVDLDGFLTIFNIKKFWNKADAGLTIKVTFKDISTDCQTGGNSISCEDYDCKDFWNDFND